MIEHFFTCRFIHHFATFLFSVYIFFGLYTIFEPQYQVLFLTLTPAVLAVGFIDAITLVAMAFQHVILNSVSLYSFVVGWLLILVISLLSIYDTQTTMLPLGVIPTLALYVLCIWEMGIRYYLLFRLSDSYTFFKVSLLSFPFVLLAFTVVALLSVQLGFRLYDFADTPYIEYFVVILLARVLLHLAVETNSRGRLFVSDQNNHLY